MKPNPPLTAPGAPGIEPRWTSSAKDGLGTAYSSSSRIWFTLSHGIINEIYYPHVDTPNTRDLQFLITDGETFCHEEKSDLDHLIEYSEEGTLLYRLTNSERESRYRIIKEIIAEPHSSVLLIHSRVEILDPALEGKLQIHALLAPHLSGRGKNNSATLRESGGRKLIHAVCDHTHLVFGCAPDFTLRSVGYVGTSDGWRDLMDDFQMNRVYDEALDGNIALTGRIDLSDSSEFVMAVAFGPGEQSATTQLLQAMATPFSQQREKYISQWQRTCSGAGLSAHDEDSASMMRLSECILLAHEDKAFPGAFVASLSIPWGETKNDDERGGYHLVWTRDMVQTATALLSSGRTESALRALIWLSCIQGRDGSVPQNSSISGKPYWKGVQLDEVAVPILLAWRLRQADALRDFDPWTLVVRAAGNLISQGPVTGQERWEENSGYSPSTLAVMIASLVCAAEFARERKKEAEADFLFEYADWLSSQVEQWTVTSRGELLDDTPRHYVRITPAIPQKSDGTADPDTEFLEIANGGGKHPARNIVDAGFLHLVRLGLRAADDPLIVDSLAVVDHVLKRDLPQGPCWCRYNHDGYGQKEDGSAFDGTGVGRAWPILTGERGHYEIAAGRDPLPFIEAMGKFANSGGMLPEQVWDADASPDGSMKPGLPTGSAMPLCWAHAEYISLVRSSCSGLCLDRIEPAFQRYVAHPVTSSHAIWTFNHPLRRMPFGKTLRLILEADALVIWSADGWASKTESKATGISSMDLWFVDLPTQEYPANSEIQFTFCWPESGHWENRNYQVGIKS